MARMKEGMMRTIALVLVFFAASMAANARLLNADKEEPCSEPPAIQEKILRKELVKEVAKPHPDLRKLEELRGEIRSIKTRMKNVENRSTRLENTSLSNKDGRERAFEVMKDAGFKTDGQNQAKYVTKTDLERAITDLKTELATRPISPEEEGPEPGEIPLKKPWWEAIHAWVTAIIVMLVLAAVIYVLGLIFHWWDALLAWWRSR